MPPSRVDKTLANSTNSRRLPARHCGHFRAVADLSKRLRGEDNGGRNRHTKCGGGRTRVVMQSTNEVHGFIGLFATRNYRRRAAYAATASHLRALLALAAAR